MGCILGRVLLLWEEEISVGVVGRLGGMDVAWVRKELGEFGQLLVWC